MIGPFEQAMLALMTFVIMLAMGASLTPRDFYVALRRPYGLGIGLVSQFCFMPLIGFVLAALLAMPPEMALGMLIIACMPGGMTSNIFTYFSKGNVALSVLMTVTSTIAGIILIPLILLLYAAALDLEIPRENVIMTLLLLVIPVGFGMALRRLNAKAGAATEYFGSGLAVFFIVILIATWVPRNWAFLLGTSPSTYAAAIGLGAIGISIGYTFARLLRLHPRTVCTVALETGIQNGPLAFTIIALTFPVEEAQKILVVPVLYSLFIVFVAAFFTLIFRHANTAGEPNLPGELR